MTTSFVRTGAAGVGAFVRLVQKAAPAGLLGMTLLALGGCASTPKGTFTYYLPRAQTTLKVTQTLTCNPAGDKLVQVVSVTPNTVYLGDPAASVTIDPSKAGGALSDSELTFELTPDGRLTSVNTSATGQAGEVVKDVLEVAKIVTGFATSTGDPKPFSAKDACAVIASYAKKAEAAEKEDAKKDGKKVNAAAANAKPAAKPAAKPGADATADKPAFATVTLNYGKTVTYKRKPIPSASVDTSKDKSEDKNVVVKVTVEGGDKEIKIDANDVQLYTALREHIPGLQFNVTVKQTTDFPAPVWNGEADVNITLNKVTAALLEVEGPLGDMSDVNKRAAVWEGVVPVPLTDDALQDRIKVPVPKSPLFGTSKFQLALSDYGTITKLSYNSSGAISASGAAASSVGIAWATKNADPTAAQQAAALKDKNDLRYQQQREAVCIAKPEDCAK